MRGMRKYLLSSAFLHDLSGVHDYNVIRHLGNYAEVMGYEHDRGVDLVLKVPEQVKDLCLDRNVQSCSGLVCNDYFRIAGKRHGDHNSLAHAA